jgi:hypothetical protein
LFFLSYQLLQSFRWVLWVNIDFFGGLVQWLLCSSPDAATLVDVLEAAFLLVSDREKVEAHDKIGTVTNEHS